MEPSIFRRSVGPVGLRSIEEFDFDLSEVQGGRQVASTAIEKAFSTKNKENVSGVDVVHAAESETRARRGFDNMEDFPEMDGIEVAVSRLRQLFPTYDQHVARLTEMKDSLNPPDMYGVVPDEREKLFSEAFATMGRANGLSPAILSDALIAPYRNQYEQDAMQYQHGLKALELIAPELTKAFQAERSSQSMMVAPFLDEFAKNFAPRPASKLPKSIGALQSELFDPKVSDDRAKYAVEAIDAYLYGPDGNSGAIASALARGDGEFLAELQGLSASAASVKNRVGPSTEQRGMEASIKKEIAQAYSAEMMGWLSNTRSGVVAKDAESRRITANASMKRANDALEVARIAAGSRTDSASIMSGGRLAAAGISAQASMQNTRLRVNAMDATKNARVSLKSLFDSITKSIESFEDDLKALTDKEGRIRPGKKAEWEAIRAQVKTLRDQQRDTLDKMTYYSTQEDSLLEMDDGGPYSGNE